MPNDKDTLEEIRQIRAALAIGKAMGHDSSVNNKGVEYLLALVVQQQEEIAHKDKFVAEWISGEDKFQDFGGWERIEAMQKELQQSREENEQLSNTISKVTTDLQGYIGDNERLRGERDDYRKVVEHYAERRNHPPFWLFDDGEFARITLSRYERGDEPR